MDVSVVAAFVALDLLLVCTPGADWAYAITAGVRDRMVLTAVVGLVAGYCGHTLPAVAGVAALVATTPSLLTALTIAGAGYLVWLGGSVLARPAELDVDAPAEALRPLRVASRGAGVSGLNPKGLLLYLAVLPQFVDPAASWSVAVQTGVLGVVHMMNCAVVYLLIGVLARTVLRVRPRVARAVTRLAGAAMISVGTLLLLERVAS